MKTLKERRLYFDDGAAWPEDRNEIRRWRRAVVAGLAVETTGTCDGCRLHRPGTPVPVFLPIDEHLAIPRGA